jgi:hypothetical protein
MVLKSSTYLLNNDIFENKCGGIRVGINFSASVLIDGNTIRDHTGPGVYAINFHNQSTTETTVLMHFPVFRLAFFGTGHCLFAFTT